MTVKGLFIIFPWVERYRPFSSYNLYRYGRSRTEGLLSFVFLILHSKISGPDVVRTHPRHVRKNIWKIVKLVTLGVLIVGATWLADVRRVAPISGAHSNWGLSAVEQGCRARGRVITTFIVCEFSCNNEIGRDKIPPHRAPLSPGASSPIKTICIEIVTVRFYRASLEGSQVFCLQVGGCSTCEKRGTR